MIIRRLLGFAVFTGLCFWLTTEISAKDDWLRLQTKNFELVGNASEKDLHNVANKLEQFRQVFKHIFPGVKFDSPIPTRVVVFKDEKSFNFFKNKEIPSGYFQPGEEVNYIALSVEKERPDFYRAIFHQYTHFLLDNSIGRAFLPPWLNEGLAEYYEQLEFGDNRQVKLGVSNNAHFQLLSKSKLIPLESFFAVDYYSLYRQRKENFQIFYAQAWLLVHYLIQGNGGVRLNDLGQFVNLLLQGRQPEFAFEQAFQTDYATIEDELKKYLRQKSFSTTSIKLPLDNEISVSEVSTAEVKALQGDLLYHISRFDDAEKFLQEALALNEDSGYALTTLGLIRMRQKNFSEAKRFLEKAIQANQKSFRIFYCYAVVLSREQMTENGFASGFSAESAEKMRESLHQSIALNPRFAESYNLLAFVNIVRNEEVDKSFEIIKEALAISPGNSWYQIRLAELHMLSQNFNAARKIVQRLILTASDDVLKVYAENTLVRINTLESQILSLKQRKNTGNEIITEEPVSADELARRRERAMLESLNRALRIPKADESRVLGVITKIDCSLQELVVSVQTNERQLNLRTDSLEGLTLIAFDESFAGTEFGCGVMKKQGLAVVTFRPLQTTQSKVQGEVVAIEFVPKNFRFSAPNK